MSYAKTGTEKLWLGGGVLGVLVLALVLWSMLVSPKRSEVDSVQSQTSDTQLQNSGLQAKLNTLRRDNANLATLQRKLAAARAALPGDSGLPAFINEVNAHAGRAHVAVTSLTAGTPAAVTPAAPTAGARPAPASSTPAPAAPGRAGAPASGGIYSIPVTIVVSGTPAAEIAFVDAVAHAGPRAALVTSASMASGQATGGGKVGMTVTAQLFTLVAPAAASTTSSTPPGA